MKEIWKPIKGYEEFYEISNKGNVRSIDRILIYKDGTVNHKKGKMIKQQTRLGYKIVQLHTLGERKTMQVHRLVANAFVSNPNNYDIVNHLDYNKENNNAYNLEWCTQKQNVNYSKAHMRKPQNTTREKYILKRGNKYRVVIKNYYMSVDRTFKTKEEARAFRDGVIQREKQYFQQR